MSDKKQNVIAASPLFNFNIGILGHVDSGKTALARALSTTASTAAFDKNPQSQERGITLDLGFSSFKFELDEAAKTRLGVSSDKIQITLVDCPGHASLIRTVIGGAQIIDLAILVLDATKGMQTQTAECLLLAEITRPGQMVVVVNKIDMLPLSSRDVQIEKLFKKLRKTLENTSFSQAPFVALSACPAADGRNEPMSIENLKQVLREQLYLPNRSKEGPFLMAVDHCFPVRGQGTVMTGTVLRGCISVNSDLQIPAANETRKIKSIQVFRKPVNSCMQGDRVGMCVTHLESDQLERGLVCAPNSIHHVYAVIVSYRRITYYKLPIRTKQRYHISLGHETVMAHCTFFSANKDDVDNLNTFDFAKDYKATEETDTEDAAGLVHFCLLQFDHAVLCPEHSLYIAARLDNDIHSTTCRLAFHGRVLHPYLDKNYVKNELPKLKIYKNKQRSGIVDRMQDDYTVIAHSLFKKETNIDLFTNLSVRLSTGEAGKIESSFGQSGKVKIRIPDGLNEKTIDVLSALGKKKGKTDVSENTEKREPVRVVLDFKRYVHDPQKKMIQT